MLELGRSQSWTRALHTISGDVKMDARPLLDYFQKLHDWLKTENKKHNRTVGWEAGTDTCEYKRYSNLRLLPLKSLSIQEHIHCDILGDTLICFLTIVCLRSV